jgi:hypothetical protein
LEILAADPGRGAEHSIGGESGLSQDRGTARVAVALHATVTPVAEIKCRTIRLISIDRDRHGLKRFINPEGISTCRAEVLCAGL